MEALWIGVSEGDKNPLHLHLEKQAFPMLHTLLPGMIPTANVHSACGCRKYVAEEPGQERVQESRQT